MFPGARGGLDASRPRVPLDDEDRPDDDSRDCDDPLTGVRSGNGNRHARHTEVPIVLLLHSSSMTLPALLAILVTQIGALEQPGV
jgi:hypothetical protein